MRRPIGVAIIGCGWAGTCRARAFSASGAALRRLMDTSPERAEALSAGLGRSRPAPRVAAQFASALDDPGVGAVAICLPHARHAEMAVAAARATTGMPPDNARPIRNAQPGPGRRTIVALLMAAGTLLVGYAGASLAILQYLAFAPRMPLTATPAALGLDYRDVTFPSRSDHVSLRGWFIPGILPDGQPTARRAIIMVHGARANRADPGTGILA